MFTAPIVVAPSPSSIAVKAEKKAPEPHHSPAKLLFRSTRKTGNEKSTHPRKGFSELSAACLDLALRRDSKPDRLAISAHSFNYTRILGQGAFGKVFMARMKYGHTPCAIKVVAKASFKGKSLSYSDILSEQHILKKIAGNPHFIELRASWHSSLNFYFLTVSVPHSISCFAAHGLFTSPHTPVLCEIE